MRGVETVSDRVRIEIHDFYTLSRLARGNPKKIGKRKKKEEE